MAPGRALPLLPAVILAGAALVGARADALASPEVRAWRVDDGTTGMLVEDHRVPVVTVEVAFPAGTWGTWGRTHHVEEAFEIQMHDPAGELRRRADLLGVRLELSAEPRWLSASLTCRKQDLEGALLLLRDVLANPSFDRAELRRRKRERSLSWSAALKEPTFVLAQGAARILFHPGDPRAKEYEKPDPVETDVPRLAAARDEAIRFPGRILGFAGDLTQDEARGAAQGLLPAPSSALPLDAAPRLADLVAASDRPRERTLTLPKLTQVYFAYGRDSLRYSDPDWPAARIADHVLGGHFNSRLMTALRLEGGETYGAGVRNEGGVDRSALGLGTFTRTENEATTERKLRHVLATFHDGGITEEERAAATSYLVGRRAFARQSPGQILDTRVAERMSGLPDGFYDDVARRAAALPLDRVNAFIRTFYDPAVFTMMKVRAP